MKHWLTISSEEKIEVVSKNHWKRFWIWLKDSKLQFFHDYSDVNPKFTISKFITFQFFHKKNPSRITDTIDSLCYPFPEHRANVFSFTAHTGETYCFQVG